jgi:hypothetical protein
MEIVEPQNVRHKLLERDMVCRSDPGNESHFCIRIHRKPSLFQTGEGPQQVHLLEPVRLHGAGHTIITVQSDETYTEVSQLTVDNLQRTDLVVAPSNLTIEH